MHKLTEAFEALKLHETGNNMDVWNRIKQLEAEKQRIEYEIMRLYSIFYSRTQNWTGNMGTALNDNGETVQIYTST